MFTFIERIHNALSSLRKRRKPIDRILPLDERSPIYALPDDIIYFIGRRLLPPSDAAAFALSCTSVWNILKGEQLLWRLRRTSGEEYDKTERMRFLEYLESHFADRLLCHQCATFHRQPRRSELRCDKDKGYIANAHLAFSLPYSTAQAVLNRYRFGERYGRSPINLRNIRVSTPKYIGATCNITSEITRGELILRADIRRLQHVKPSHQGSAEEEEGDGKPRYLRCQACYTKRKTVKYKLPCGKYREVKSTAWMNLGSTSAILDQRWERLTNNPTYDGITVLPITLDEYLDRASFDDPFFYMS